jgi:hypothetical protein
MKEPAVFFLGLVAEPIYKKCSVPFRTAGRTRDKIVNVEISTQRKIGRDSKSGDSNNDIVNLKIC